MEQLILRVNLPSCIHYAVVIQATMEGRFDFSNPDQMEHDAEVALSSLHIDPENMMAISPGGPRKINFTASEVGSSQTQFQLSDIIKSNTEAAAAQALRPRPPPVRYVDADSIPPNQRVNQTSALSAPRVGWLSERGLQSPVIKPQWPQEASALTSPRGRWLVEKLGYLPQPVISQIGNFSGDAASPQISDNGQLSRNGSWNESNAIRQGNSESALSTGAQRIGSVYDHASPTSRQLSFEDPLNRKRTGSGGTHRSSLGTPLTGEVSTPMLLITESQENTKEEGELESVVIDEETLKTVADKLHAHAGNQVAAVNFVPDDIYFMSTKEFNAFLKREKFDPGLVKLLKESRRRSKNRLYAEKSRRRNKERQPGGIKVESRSPSLSPSVRQPSSSGVASAGAKMEDRNSSESLFEKAMSDRMQQKN